MFTSSKWLYRVERCGKGIEPVSIERVDGFAGVRYAVRQCGACMDAAGNWELEPMPSSRTDEWLNQFRFATWGEAADAIMRHCKHPWGRLAHYDTKATKEV